MQTKKQFSKKANKQARKKKTQKGGGLGAVTTGETTEKVLSNLRFKKTNPSNRVGASMQNFSKALAVARMQPRQQPYLLQRTAISVPKAPQAPQAPQASKGLSRSGQFRTSIRVPNLKVVSRRTHFNL